MKPPIKSKQPYPHYHHLSTETRGISMDMTKHQHTRKYLTPKYYTKEDIPLDHPLPRPNEKFHSFSPNKTNTNTDNSLLPSLKSSESQLTKTLVLDLDETLIHSSFNQFSIEANITIQVDLEHQSRGVYVLLRPYLNEFLIRVSKDYEIVIFTASQAIYANRLIDLIDKDKVCKHRLFREQCTLINGVYVKELKRLNRNMKNVIIVDNNPNSFSLDKENGIPIKSFIDDKSDNELIQMAYVLEKIAKVSDVRVIIGELVYMNQIDYDKAFELFKMKKEDNKVIEQLSINDKAIDLIISKEPVKIIKVEKVDIKSSKTIESTMTTVKGNEVKDKSFISATGFYSFGNRSQSKGKGKEESISTKNNTHSVINQFERYKHNNRNISEKVKLIPKSSIKDYNNNNSNSLMTKNKSKNSINDRKQQSQNQKNIADNTNTNNNNDQTTKRPLSVIPLKPNSLKKKSDNKELVDNSSNIKLTTTNKDYDDNITENTNSNTTNISNKLFKGDLMIKDTVLPFKKHQSSRISLHNLPTIISHPRSHRAKHREDTQNSISSKVSISNQGIINQKKRQMTLKFIDSQPKHIPLKSGCKIVKIISNNTVTSFNRSKTSNKQLK